MSLHINRFIDRLRSLEHKGQRDFVMSMAEARDLQADLAKLLLALHMAAKTSEPDPTTTVEIDGGGF